MSDNQLQFTPPSPRIVTTATTRRLAAATLFVAALIALTLLPGISPASASDTCVTSDADLLAQVEAKVTRHATQTGRTDLHEMFSRSLETMKGNDTYTVADIKARPDKQGSNWQGSGSNPLWQAVYAELDRLETCRAAPAPTPTPTPAPALTPTPTPPTPAVSIAAGSGVTEGGSATFTITASPSPSSSLTVSLSVTQSGDYAASGATGTKSVSIPTSGSATYSVATLDDTADEADGSVTVAISGGSGYTVGSSSSASVSVSDNDDPPAQTPVVSIAAGSDVTEGGSANFTFTASPAPTSNLTVSLSVTQSGDYAASGATGTKSVTIPTGGSATYSVATLDDSADEADGSVSVSISGGKGYSVGSPSSASVSVSDNDDPPAQPAQQVQPVQQQQDAQETAPDLDAPAPAKNTARLLSSGQVLVGWPDYSGETRYHVRARSANGHGTEWGYNQTGNWYVFKGLKPGVWVIETMKTDFATRLGVWMIVSVPERQTAPQKPAAQDGDPAPTPSVSVSGGSGVTEGGSANFTFTASPAPTSNLTVSLTVSQSGDYAASGATGTKSVTIPTGGSATYSVATLDDSVDEADGSVTVAISGGSGYSVGSTSSASVSVSDNDDPPSVVPTVSIAAGSDVTEGANASFTVTASPAPTSNLSVSLTVSQSGDYAASGATGTKSVTIPTGGSATYSVATVDDAVDEADGSVNVSISGGNGYTVGSTSSASVSVSDNDDPPAQTPVVSIAAGSGITEGSAASFTVTASPAPASSLSVALSVSQNGDYAAAGTTGAKSVIIGTSGTATYSVATLDDAVDEADGSVNVSISGGNGYSVGTSASASVSVADNDDPPAQTPVVSIAAGSGVAEGANASFTFTASPAPTSNLTVSLIVSQNGDYAASGATGTKSVTIPTSGSATYSVVTLDDAIDEADGSVSVAISGGNGYTVGSTSSASVGVADNDNSWWTPILSAAEPPEHAVSLLTPKGNDVLFGWPTKEDYTHYNLRAVYLGIEEHPSRHVSNYEGNWWVFEDLNPGRWLVEVRDSSGWAHGGNFYITVPVDGEGGGGVIPELTLDATDSAKHGIAEGEGATFILRARPAPQTPLDVKVSIGQSGDFAEAGSTGTRTVTIPSRGFAFLRVNTVDDKDKEKGGRITATLVKNPSAYVVTALSGNASINVSDNDIPEVSISAGPGVIEGGSVSFTLTVSKATLSSPLPVSIDVGQSGYFGAQGATGFKTVNIPTSGSLAYTIATVDDERDEADGYIILVVNDGNEYDLSATASVAKAPVHDNDPDGAGLTCLTTDSDLLTRVAQAQDANSRNPELNLMLGRAYNTMKGNDAYSTVDIKVQKRGEAEWQGSGKDALWQAIYTELDRLEVCRGPQIVQIVDNTPGKEQLNTGQSATITSTANTRDHDNDSSTPVGIVEGEGACFTVTLNPAPTAPQRVKFSVYQGLASDSSATISRSGGFHYIAFGHTGVGYHGIPTSGTRTICIPTVNDRTDEKDAQIWMRVSDDVGGTGWHRINVYDDDEPVPASEQKRIPWAEPWTRTFHGGGTGTLAGPAGNRFHMGIAWGIPEYYRQADVRAGKDRAGEGRYEFWDGPHVTYCIQIIKAEQGWNYDRPGNVPNLDGYELGKGRVGDARCTGNTWLPYTRATDRWDNGGARENWMFVTGGATYTFGIWVQGDKANSYREFKHTVRNPGGCVKGDGYLVQAFRYEYVCSSDHETNP